MRWWAAVVVAGCTGGAPKSTSSPTSTTSPIADTADSATTVPVWTDCGYRRMAPPIVRPARPAPFPSRPRPPVVPLPPTPTGTCATEHLLSTGALGLGWISPSGTLYAAGAPPVRVRAPDGTWSSDPPDPITWSARAIDGSADDDVWLVAAGHAYRREPDGTWADQGLPTTSGDAFGLHVAGPADVTVLIKEYGACYDCPTREVPVVQHWDGVAWTETRYPEVRGGITSAVILADGTIVVAAGGELSTLGAAGGPVPQPVDVYVRRVLTAEDGTLIALGDTAVLSGTVAGMSVVGTGMCPSDTATAWATSASDVWVAYTTWDDVAWAWISHWDGVEWTDVVSEDPGGWYGLVGSGDQVFALGGYDHESVLVGGLDGFVSERESWGVDTIEAVSIDDVTGIPWGVGYPVLAMYDRDLAAWGGVPLPDRSVGVGELVAATQGRVGFASDEALHVYADGALTTTDRPGAGYHAMARASGSLFAVGHDDDGMRIEQESGSGWVTLPLTGLPAITELTSAWADSPTDLYVGFEEGDAGGVAYWDGVAWTVVVSGLDRSPDWMARLADGELYFTQFEDAGAGDETLWAWDGAAAAPVPDLVPDVRAAHLFADGTRFLSAITDDPDLGARIAVQAPGGVWVDLVVAHFGFDLVGDGTTAWANGLGESWTLSACP